VIKCIFQRKERRELTVEGIERKSVIGSWKEEKGWVWKSERGVKR